jgi:hypothetical protein
MVEHMKLKKEADCTLTKMNVKLCCAVIAITISGCVTPPSKYIEPTGQSVATIDFIDETNVPMGVDIYKDATECTDRTVAGPIQPKIPKKLRVSAGKELAFTAAVRLNGESNKTVGTLGAMGGALGALTALTVMSATNNVCITTIEFLPEADRNYVFQLNTDGVSCGYTLVTGPTPGQQTNEAVPVIFNKREWIRAWGESGPWCKKK